MGSLRIVILDPGRDELAGMIQSEEQALVQQLIAHAAVERLDIAVLHRLARGNGMPLDPMLGTPGQNGVRGEFGAVSETIIPGLPRRPIKAVSSRATRLPEIEV